MAKGFKTNSNEFLYIFHSSFFTKYAQRRLRKRDSQVRSKHLTTEPISK